MVNEAEPQSALDLLDQAAENLKITNRFERELSPKEMLSLAQRTLDQIKEKQPDIQLDTSNLGLTIKESTACLSGRIDLQSDLASGTIEAGFSLRNDPRPGQENRVLGNVDRLKANVRVNVPIKAGGVEELIRDQVQGIMFQKGFTNLVTREMEERGVAVRNVGLHLLLESLKIILSR